jgi:hypothetical protein
LKKPLQKKQLLLKQKLKQATLLRLTKLKV